MHARLRGSKSLFILYQIINKPDFPSLADEIAEPHPDMNIKVAAFTVSEKSSNTFSVDTHIIVFIVAHFESNYSSYYSSYSLIRTSIVATILTSGAY